MIVITVIGGDPGTGKTKLAVALYGIRNMVGGRAKSAVRLAEQLTAEVKNGIYLPNTQEIYTGQDFKKLVVPQNHLVYSDTTIEYNLHGRIKDRSYDISGWRVGLANNEWETHFIPPASTIILDEAQVYYDSSRGNYLPPFVSRMFEIHRHVHYNFVLVSQRPVSIMKRIRGMAEKFIFIEKCYNIKNSYGRTIRTIWNCVEFSSTESAEAYSDSKRITDIATKTTYWYDGDINKCYDPYARKAVHFAGREGSEYAQTPSRSIEENRRKIDKNSDASRFEAPKVFLGPAKEAA